MPKHYVIDEIGNKYESMTKDEILQSIGAGGERENVFTGEITYNSEIVDYMYTGEKPSDDIILKLLQTGLEPDINHLTDLEIMTIVSLADFTIHYYYTDGELYVSNRNDNSIKFFKAGIGVMVLYPNQKEISYYIKSSKKINDVLFMSEKEFEDTPKQEEAIYIVDDAEYTQNVIVNCHYDGSNISLGDNELKKLINNSYDRLLLKMNYTNTEDTQYEFLKLKQYTNDSRYDTYEFENSQHYIEISITQETLDSINLFGQVVPKATYANYADYAIKNPNGSYSKFTHESNGVLKVGDNHIISKKMLLWSGEVNIKTSEVADFIDIFTSTDSLKGKKLEIWVQDKGLNYMFEPITLKVNVPYGSSELFQKRYISTDDLDIGIIYSYELTLRYNSSNNTFDGRYIRKGWNIENKTYDTAEIDCYVTAIYEIIE